MNEANVVTTVDVRFNDDALHVFLSDGRQLSLPLDAFPWLNWLLSATPEQCAGWSIEPGGYAIYWEELDDGIEIAHLLGLQPLS